MAEVDFPTTTPEEIRRAFLTDGSVLLRRFARPERLDELRDDVRRFYELCENETGKGDLFHIFPVDLIKIQQRQFHEYIFDGRHYDLLTSLFRDLGYHVSPHTVTRGVNSNAEKNIARHQPPLLPHLDTFFHGFYFTVNFWVPFQACGDDRPSLGVVRAPIAEMISFTGYDGEMGPDPDGNWCFGRFRPEMLKLQNNDPDLLRWLWNHFEDRVWTPKYEYGDAMMISNWTLHFTHSHPGMVAQRENVELRFQCKAGWQAVLPAQDRTVPPRHRELRGRLYGLDGASVTGWAADASADEHVTVEFFRVEDDGRRTRLGSAQANLLCDELRTAGFERLDHGFTWRVPSAEKAIVLSARIAETGVELPGSPIIVSPHWNT